jgi:hypothetical protein
MISVVGFYASEAHFSAAIAVFRALHISKELPYNPRPADAGPGDFLARD